MKYKKILKRQKIDYNIIRIIESMRENPFNISFGKEPKKLLSRQNQVSEIVSVFNNDNPETESYILTGPRGCGKTVLLSQIKKEFDSFDNWITIDLNPCMEMHEQMASRLYESGRIKKLFLKTEFSFSFKGVSISLSGDKKVSDVYSLIKQMLIYLKKKNIRVLITIDDISKNNYVKAFAHTFQSLIREGYLVFFIASGIYNNVSSLYNDKALTFLLRTPKVLVEPLNIRLVALSYKDIFKINLEKAISFAKLTSGYAYAYQLLGSLLFKENKFDINKKILEEFDVILEDRVYSQIWKELSKKEKEILIKLSNNDNIDNSKLAKIVNIKNNALQVYRKFLIYSGLVSIEERGKMKLALPRFKEFVLFRSLIE